MNIIIFGGTGFLGGVLTAQLISAGHRVTIVARDREAAKSLAMQPNVTVRELRLRGITIEDDTALANTLRGHGAAINLVGILHERNAGDFARAHRDLTAQLLARATACGVQRFIQVSALGAGVNAPSNYQRSKGEAEVAIRASNLNWTIFAPSVMFGRGDSFLSMFAQLLKAVPPFIPLPMPRLNARFQPVWVEDAARAITASLENPKTFKQRYELVGPKVHTLREIVTHVGARVGRSPWLINTPNAIAPLQAAVLECVPGGPLMSRDNVRSMSVDNVSAQAWPAFALPAPTAMETVTATYLGDVPDAYAAYRAA